MLTTQVSRPWVPIRNWLTNWLKKQEEEIALLYCYELKIEDCMVFGRFKLRRSLIFRDCFSFLFSNLWVLFSSFTFSFCFSSSNHYICCSSLLFESQFDKSLWFASGKEKKVQKRKWLLHIIRKTSVLSFTNYFLLLFFNSSL